MTIALTCFPPTRLAAENRLEAFLPKAGRAYAKTRNFDHGPGRHDNVSSLSPYLRMRLLDEVSVSRAVLDQHSMQDADKFLTEVFWRTYWKGWMELRPSVWDEYMLDLNRLHDAVQTQSGLRDRWEEACMGQTGIPPFDAWAHELVDTGYLHNHARMWFASIWTFTLELPWQLGADFFMRHLLDGDVASNTLGWRWVAGIQTRGKTYLAMPDNIEKFTGGRFRNVKGLSRSAIPPDAPPTPPPGMLSPCDPLPVTGRYGILVHSEDVDATPLLEHAPNPVAFAYADATAAHSPWHMAPHVSAFRRAVASDMFTQYTGADHLASAAQIATWAAQNQLDQIIAPYATVGPIAQLLQSYQSGQDTVPISLIRRPLDTAAWPLATKGFFPFRKNIPELIGQFVRR